MKLLMMKMMMKEDVVLSPRERDLKNDSIQDLPMFERLMYFSYTDVLDVVQA
jgi:hypothetical protein